MQYQLPGGSLNFRLRIFKPTRLVGAAIVIIGLSGLLAMTVPPDHLTPALVAVKQSTVQKIEMLPWCGTITAGLAIQLQELLNLGELGRIDNRGPHGINNAITPAAILFAAPRFPGDVFIDLLFPNVSRVREKVVGVGVNES